MRRSTAVMATAATGVAVWVLGARSGTWARWRARLAAEIGPGAMPGELGSRINSWLNTELYAQVADELDLQPDDDLLDVACGAGAFLAEHGTPARFVAGLDLSQAKVELARQRLAERTAAGTAEIAQGEAGSMPWEDGRFSVVTTMDAINWFPDPARALVEMHRVLRPGGRAVLQFGFRRAGEMTGTREYFGGAVTDLGDADVRRLTVAAGFGNVDLSYRRTAGSWRIYDRMLRAFGAEEMRIVRAVRPAVVPADTPAVPATEAPALAGSA